MRKIQDKASIILFLMIQVSLYTVFLTLDLTNGSIQLSNWIKFCIIIICFCYALLFSRKYILLEKGDVGRSILFLLQTAMLFTLISDLLILILDYYFYGVLTFIVVQLLHGLRLIIVDRGWHKNTAYISAALLRRILLQVAVTCVVCYLLLLQGVIINQLLIVSVLYFIGILSNAISAVHIVVKDPKDKGNLIFAIGIFLFLLCDINVGVFNMSGFITLPQRTYEVMYCISSILMWTFYAPSQVLITLSGHRVSEMNKND